KRLDPTKLVAGAKSVIVLLYNYFPQNILPTDDGYKISKYAYGEDYHTVIKDKLRTLCERYIEYAGAFSGRVFVDSAPVLERVWAQRAGLGWIGKNTLLLSKQKGSYFFVAEIILDHEFEYDNPLNTDYCGTCTACVDACPTNAITPHQIDARKCISYLTIELREQIPEDFKGTYEDWIFGCDICQEVCPWNRFSTPHQEPRFHPHSMLNAMDRSHWEEFTQDIFTTVFKKSAVKRTGFNGLKRNIDFLKD
ncbi:MAG: tRNA epoxyqueuosine(34) reductase QueG, partial [Cyclobacteriaceae bacterium]|nr:tRNA epoxyqueuosine(34) reductase QueG [Cyclobacteriaceae bacterium]